MKPGRDDSGYAMTYDDETKRKLDEARAGKAAADEKAEEAQRIATRALAEAASSRELVTQLSQRPRHERHRLGGPPSRQRRAAR